MRVAMSLLALGAIAATGSTTSAGTVVSTFDTFAEQWQSFQNGDPVVEYKSTGGNPGGYIALTDGTSQWAYLQAPAKFRLPGLYGGTLSFDLRAFTSDASAYPIVYGVRVALVGAGKSLLAEAQLPTSTWTNYQFDLTETGGWRVTSTLDGDFDPTAPLPSAEEFREILASAPAILVAADYTDGTVPTGVFDRTELDNVRYNVIPLPPAVLMAGLGFIGVAGWTYTRSRGSVSAQ